MTQEIEVWDDTAVTQEIEVWDDTAETTTTKDSVETDPKPLSAVAEADSLAIAESVVETVSGPPVFDPEAPHVTHVSVVGRHHLQGGHLFSIGTKAHVVALQEIQ